MPETSPVSQPGRLRLETLHAELVENFGRSLFRHPFILSLAAGTLPQKRYDAFVIQDIPYLKVFSAVLENLGQRVRNAEMADDLAALAKGADEYREYFERDALDRNLSPAPLSEPIAKYISHLRYADTRPAVVTACAVLPCFHVYGKVGEEYSPYLAPDCLWGDFIRSNCESPVAEQIEMMRSVARNLLSDACESEWEEARQMFFASCSHEARFWSWVLWES